MGLVSYIKSHVAGAALSAASVIVAMQLVLPGFFDLVFDLILIGLIWVVSKFGNHG